MATITSSISDPSDASRAVLVLTTPGEFSALAGDTITISGHTGSDPDLNGDHVLVGMYSGVYPVIAVALNSGGTGGTVVVSAGPPAAVIPIQIKRGATSEVAAYTGGAGNGGTAAEPVWDAEKKRLHICMGADAGGTIIGPELPGSETRSVILTAGEEFAYHLVPPNGGPFDATPKSINIQVGDNNFAGTLYLGQPADDTVNGGNRRQVGAIDFQTERAAADQVASGARSVILGGANNRASGSGAVAIGTWADAADPNSLTHASGRFADLGDGQSVRWVQRRQTSNATPGSLVLVQGPPGKTRAFHILIVARKQGGTDFALFNRLVLSNRAAAELPDVTVQTVGTDIKSSGAAAWDLALGNSDTELMCVGEAGTNIRWVASVTVAEVAFPA